VNLKRSPRALAGSARARARALVRGRNQPPPLDLAGPRLLRAFADANPRASFVEIGSNDGEQHDHLRPFILTGEWTGIMVEPVPYVFERLRGNYGSLDRVELENAAIGEADGATPFYYLVDASEEERRALPDWYDGIGSFSRTALLSHAPQIPDIESRVISAPVPTLTFDSLCRKHGVDHVDLLLIDTEGFDAQIIGSIDLRAWAPQLLVYEHFHLTVEERAACAARVRGCGYETLEEGFDTFCLHESVGGPVRHAWQGLRPALPVLSKHDETA
jgi:FkbM family methyltransferase